MNILFVCTGNTCRSPMAAAMMNKFAKDSGLDIAADSAGIFAQDGFPASPNAILAMSEYDIDISGHRSKPIDEELINSSDLILTMTNGHKQLLMPVVGNKLFTLNEYAGLDGDIPDPYGGSADEYRETASCIYEAVRNAAKRIAYGSDKSNDKE